MSMIFPGMDPYLEDPQIWSGFHAPMIVYIRDVLQPQLRPRYVAAVEERVYVEGPDRQVVPDVWIRQAKARKGNGAVAVAEPDEPVKVRVQALEIHEALINILDRRSGQRIVTVIEMTSPTNKFPGPGQKSYLDKQKEVRESESHLVEIDLLRIGHHVLAVPEWAARKEALYHYLVSVNRAQGVRDLFEIYPRTLRQHLPRIRIPLAEGDPDVVLDLQAVVNQNYELAGYADRIHYEAPCPQSLSPEDQAWANQLIEEARKKSNGTA